MRPRLPSWLSLLALIPALLGADEPLPSGALRRLGVATPAPPPTPDSEDQEAEQRQRRAEAMRSVMEVCLGEDGKAVTTRKGDGTVQVWDLATGKPLHRWRLDGNRRIRLSPDGKVVAVAGEDKTLVLHAADTGKLLRRFSRPLPADLGTLAFSADGKTLIAGHFKPAEFSLWDVATGQMLCWEKAEHDLIVAAALSPGAKVLALGSFEGSLCVWDRAAHKLRCRRDGYLMGEMAFSPDGSLLAARGYERCIWLWEAKDYQPVRRLAWHGPGASLIAFSPDGKLLASNAGREVVLWEVATGKVRRTFSGHQGAVTAGAFTPDGKRPLTGSADGSVLVWDLTAPSPPIPPAAPVRNDRDGAPLPLGARARLGSVRLYLQDSCLRLDFGGRRLAFSGDGKSLFVGLPQPEDGYPREDESSQPRLDLHPSDSTPGVCMLDVLTGKEGPHLQDVPDGIDCLAHSPDGRTLAALTGPTLYLWDTHTAKQRKMAHVDLWHARTLVYSPDGQLLAAASEQHIVLLDADSGRCLHRLQGHPPEVADLAFSHDGKRLISCSRPEHQRRTKTEDDVSPGAVMTWDVASGKSVGRMSIPADAELHSFCLSPDGTALAAGRKESIRLWDIGTGREKRSLPAAASALAFSPDGKLLAAAGPGLRLWDHATGKEVRSLPAPDSSVEHVLFSPDGKRLAILAGMRVHFWDVLQGQEIVTHEGHRGAIAALACSADGKLVLSGGQDRALCLWDVPAGKVLRLLRGHETGVVALALSADGKWAASQDSSGRACIWEVATGRQVHRAEMGPLLLAGWHRDFSRTAAFSADGRTLLVTGASGLVRLWQALSWKELRSFQGDRFPVAPPALSPDGKHLAIPEEGDFEQKARLRMLETSTGREQWRIEHKDRQGKLLAAACSSDGGFLAVSRVTFHAVGFGSTVDDTQLAIHESSTGKEVLALDTSFPVSVLTFSPEGKKLAAASGYGSTFSLWDVRTGKLLGDIAGHKGAVAALAFSADGRTLFSASTDGSILVWGVNRLPLRQPERPRGLTPRRLEESWDDLAGADAARAFRAIADLSSVPEKTLPFLQARLRAARVEDPHRLARLIADLDSEEFAVRENATRQLTTKVDQAESALRQVLRGQPALETRRRLERILEHLQASPEQRRAWRVCLVLDWLDTPEADRLLQKLAGGAADVRLTREARAALARRASQHRSFSRVP